jgi:hypothetical protein
VADEQPDDSGLEAFERGEIELGQGHERLAAHGAEAVAQVGSDRAPRRLRSERLPAEVREAIADTWDLVAAEVLDYVKLNGAGSVASRAGRRGLWRRLEKVLDQAQMVAIQLGHAYPIPGGRWRHRAVGTVGAGGLAAGEQVVVGASVVSGPVAPIVLAITSAVLTEFVEIYVSASARMERYQHAARTPSPASLAADIAAAYGASGLGTRSADRRMLQEALQAMLRRVVRRSEARFAETLAIGVGPIAAGLMTGSAVMRAQRRPLREPDQDEIGRLEPS